ncbi:acyltransferase [Proteus mirabilis]|uniref:Galactoside O-acetyltransferase n=3 Tax=Proteus mirabilis TaxID=584 RepID=A0A385JN83_PROMI|nr:acyltransferase [Proteus mirabilis]AXY99812.1 galactoside O-acetyltransferase [Proteus mirabilis]EKU0762680.1 acyltransferase [Proteus mirabilis]EKX9206053.1 acyltransferase [Proteus mirabilis]ELB1228607.1 acyltransferase [Proteus mirabilis]ELT8917931.1 acyltransferase [Proteus mirabilis]
MIKNIIFFILNFFSQIIAYFYILKWKLGFNYKDQAISISVIKGKLGYKVRSNFYQRTLNKCGNKLSVHYGAYIAYPQTVIGNRCSIEEYSVISLAEIGNDVIIASNVVLLSGSKHHEIDDLSLKFHDSNIKMTGITLGDNIWIGVNSVIMANIASGTIIGAGSVLTKSIVIENCIYAGIPAKYVRNRGVL